MKYIYIDSLFLLSLFTDYLLCLVSARFCGLYLRRKRYLLAALFGALYSVAVFLPGLSFLALPLMELVSAGIMGLIAFGGEKQLFRCMGVFLAISASFGGAIWALTLHAGELPGLDMGLLLCLFLLCYLLLGIISRTKLKKAEKHRLHVELRLDGRESFFLALQDTGNCLTDPVSGAAVMIVSPRALYPLFPQCRDVLDMTDPVQMLEESGRRPQMRGKLRLLSYSSLGGEGLLPVFRPDAVMVEGRERRGLMAGISASACADGFDALIPGS